MRHRRGTPGLTPYRLRTIELGYPRRRRPARHLRRTADRAASRAASRAADSAASRAADSAASRAADSAAGSNAGGAASRFTSRFTSRFADSQVALGVGGAIALALLVIGGYQAAAGAAVVLGMF